MATRKLIISSSSHGTRAMVLTDSPFRAADDAWLDITSSAYWGGDKNAKRKVARVMKKLCGGQICRCWYSAKWA